MSDTEKDVEKGQEVKESPEEEKVNEKRLEAEKAEEKPDENEVNVKLLNADDEDAKQADAVYTKDGPLADPEAVEVKLSPQSGFQGLGKEELMQQCNTPVWKMTRIALLVVFWLAWFGMLVAVIVLIATSPKCPTNKEWYQTGISYQIYPRSFKDSDGDGTGDLAGIESKLEYLKDIGVNAIWLGQIFPTKMADMGNDVTNFTGIDEDFGTEKEFDSLIAKVHLKGMRLVMEFIPNHSSDEHPWFNKSRESKSVDNKYRDYYIWADGIAPGEPPSNWVSRFSQPAWKYEPLRDQWYLHTFSEKEPDLNFRNENVTKEITNAMEYWLNKKVDGFYLPYANQLIESAILELSEPDNMYYQKKPNDTETPYDSFLHNATRDQPETIDLLASWRKLFDEKYSGPDSDDYVILVAGAPSSGIDAQMSYYGSSKKPAANYPYNFQLMDLCTSMNKTGRQVSALVKSWLKGVGEIGPYRTTNWALGDSEHSRIATRCGPELVKAMNTLLLTLPGSPTAYYGDEIGMGNIEITAEESMDSLTYSSNPVINYNLTREHFVSPMQWDDDNLAGFSNGTESWLPVNNDYMTVNVNNTINNDTSDVSKFKALQTVRRAPSLIGGKLTEVFVSNEVYSFKRVFDKWPGFFVAINLGSFSYQSFQDKRLPEEGTIVYCTHTDRVGNTVKLRDLQLQPYEACIVEYKQ